MYVLLYNVLYDDDRMLSYNNLTSSYMYCILVLVPPPCLRPPAHHFPEVTGSVAASLV